MPPQEEINAQLDLLASYRRTLAHYLKQQATLTKAYTRPEVTHGIHEAREEIRRIKQILDSWGVEVADHPDDEEREDIQKPPRSGGRPSLARERENGGALGNRIYWLFFPALALAVLVGAAIAIFLTRGARVEPATVYFVVDATDKMRPIFNDVRTQVQLAAHDSVRDDSRIGLRTYGGANGDTGNCQDSRQLLEPSGYPQAQQLLDLVLAGVSPRGHSSLTGAVLDTMASDLQHENGPVLLFLVTAGIDPLCDPPAGDFLKNRAKDIGRNVQLVIISIGEENPSNRLIFETYAKEFHGEYRSIPNAESLPPIIKSFSLYSYGYGYPSYGLPPTLSP